MKNVVAIDFDGTLVDCRTRQLEVLRAVAPTLCPEQLGKIWQVKRSGHNTIAALSMTGMDKEQAITISSRWQAIIEEPYWLTLDTVFAGILDSLRLLRSHGMHLVLVSARNQSHWLRQQLKQLNLREIFDEVFVVHPACAAEEKAQRLRTLRPIAMIGDTESDGFAAQASSTRFMAVESGQRSREFLAKNGFVDCENSFNDIVTRLLNTSMESLK